MTPKPALRILIIHNLSLSTLKQKKDQENEIRAVSLTSSDNYCQQIRRSVTSTASLSEEHCKQS